MKNIAEWLTSNAGFAEWGLLLVAFATAIFAVVQLRDSRELRFQQARPYVVAGLRRVDHGIVELYVKNFGKTAAYNVRFASEPKLESVTDAEAFRVFDTLPTLVPSEEWSTIWEIRAYERAKGGSFSNRYDVTISYTGNDGRSKRSLVDRFVLDWEPHLNTTYLTEHSIHDVAAALKKIEGYLQPRRVFRTNDVKVVLPQVNDIQPERERSKGWRSPGQLVRRIADRLRT